MNVKYHIEPIDEVGEIDLLFPTDDSVLLNALFILYDIDRLSLLNYIMLLTLPETFRAAYMKEVDEKHLKNIFFWILIFNWLMFKFIFIIISCGKGNIFYFFFFKLYVWNCRADSTWHNIFRQHKNKNKIFMIFCIQLHSCETLIIWQLIWAHIH